MVPEAVLSFVNGANYAGRQARLCPGADANLLREFIFGSIRRWLLIASHFLKSGVQHAYLWPSPFPPLPQLWSRPSTSPRLVAGLQISRSDHGTRRINLALIFTYTAPSIDSNNDQRNTKKIAAGKI